MERMFNHVDHFINRSGKGDKGNVGILLMNSLKRVPLFQQKENTGNRDACSCNDRLSTHNSRCGGDVFGHGERIIPILLARLQSSGCLTETT